MAILKAKEIRQMKPEEKEKKLKELKLELVKAEGNAQQGSSKKKQIKRTIARLLTLK